MMPILRYGSHAIDIRHLRHEITQQLNRSKSMVLQLTCGLTGHPLRTDVSWHCDNKIKNRISVILLGSILLVFSYAVQAEKKVMTAEEAAKELANPNTPLASLNFKNQFRWFDGDLPNANSQSSYSLLFQPSLPFPLDNGGMVFFRPAIPLVIDQPIPNSVNFKEESGIGDIVFDLAYAPKRDDDLLVAYGLVSSLPTATEKSLGTDRLTIGPEILYGKVTKEYVMGVFPNHQWSIAGSGQKDISLTTIQVFGSVIPGGGWNYGSSPIMSYDWKSEQWTIPLNFNFGKTTIWNERPWKLSMEINYYIERADTFAPEWMIGFNLTPVVNNGLVDWFK